MAASPGGESTTERREDGRTGVEQQVWLINASKWTFAARRHRRGVHGGFGPASVAAVKAALFLVALAVAAPGAARGDILFAGGGWAAIDRGQSCEAATRALAAARKDRPPALARFAFTPDRRRWGEFSARLSRQPRSGSSVMLQIGPQRFLLFTRGISAWSRGGLQEQALIAAVRGTGAMRIEGRDAAGRRFADRYALAGAATAIDAAAARCAGKMTRK